MVRSGSALQLDQRDGSTKVTLKAANATSPTDSKIVINAAEAQQSTLLLASGKDTFTVTNDGSRDLCGK